MTKEIILTKGKVTLVSDEWYEYLNQWKWYALYDPTIDNYYAIKSVRREDNPKKYTLAYMHRIILGLERGNSHYADHINGNGLDNRLENLRIVTNSENQRNRGRSKNNTSGYKGVGWHKRMRKWQARITLNKKDKHLGYFSTPQEAHEAYKKASKEYHGEFARFE